MSKDSDLSPHHKHGHTQPHDSHQEATDSLVCGHRIADGVIITKEASVEGLIEDVQQ